MRTVTYRLADLKNLTINLGFVGENEHTVFRFDCMKAFEEYPDAVPSLAVTPPSGDPYPAVTIRNGDYVEWTINDSDVAIKGNGEAQLTFIQDNVVMKEYIFRTKIERSILPTGEAPDPIQNWIDEANEALGTISGAVEDAEEARDAAVEAQGKAETAQGKAEDAQGYAESAQTAAETAQGLAEGARDSAQGYASDAESARDLSARWATGETSGTPGSTNNSKYYAEQASGKASEAAQSASDASGYATTASNKAGEASQSASDASGYATTASNKAVDAADSASAAAGSATTASNKAGEASNSATSASGSATSANADALKAEGYAVGKQNGTDVSSSSPYYHKNAKYYADSAAQSAEDAQDVLDSIPQDYTQLSNNVSNLKSALTFVTGVEPYQWIIGKKINSNGDTIDWNSFVSDSNFVCVVVDCEEGDAFTATTQTNNTVYRRWAFADENGNRLAYGLWQARVENEIIYAPANAKKLICNAYTGNGEDYNLIRGYNLSERFCLESTGDNTDVSSAIMNRLDADGICKLGVGVFYVSGVTMKPGQTLIGSGAKTIVRLLDSVTSGVAIALDTDCTIREMTISGADDDITLTGTVGNRHGISWLTNSDDGTSTKFRPSVYNVRINGFSGGGIYCMNTGISINTGGVFDGIFVSNCEAGIYIPQLSEFNHFANVSAKNCYYGAICNGGNNTFVNCGFDGNSEGFRLYNSPIGQHMNDSHSQCIGCTFHHNTVHAIYIRGNRFGFVFSGCHVGSADICVEQGSGGVVFSGMNIIDGANISLVNPYDVIFSGCSWRVVSSTPQITVTGVSATGGGAVLFDGCIANRAPVITVTDNDNVFFDQCYTATGEVFGAGYQKAPLKNIIPIMEAGTNEHNGLTYVSDGKGRYTVSGTTTNASYLNFFISMISLPAGFSPNRKYRLRFDPDNTNLFVRVRFYTTEWGETLYYVKDSDFIVPSDAVGMQIGLYKGGSGAEVPGITVKPEVYDVETLEYAINQIKKYSNEMRRPMMLTIIDDDGNAKYYNDVLPVAVAKNVSISSAIPVETVGTGAKMTWEQIEVVLSAGCEILSHSYHHWNGTDPTDMAASEEQIATDYRKAKNILAIHGVTNSIHVYNGSTGGVPKFVEASKKVYKYDFRPSGGYVIGTDGVITLPHNIPRYSVTDCFNADNYATMKGYVDALIATGEGWIVFMMHTSDGAWNSETSPAYLGDIIDYAKANGVSVVTAECGIATYLGT